MLDLEIYIMEQIGLHKGLLHIDTIEQSQRVDKIIVAEQKRRGEVNGIITKSVR